MGVYLIFAIVAYFLFAVSGIIDKFLLSKVVHHPIVYTFFIGITGPLSFLLAPFGLEMLSGLDLFVAIVAGVSFTIGLFFLYTAIASTSVTRILPIEGGLVPMFTLALAFLFLGERLETTQYWACAILVLGSVLISFRKEHGQWQVKALRGGVFAAFLFAVSFVLTKYIFEQSNFISGMVWTRLGLFLTALMILTVKSFRTQIFNAPRQAGAGNIGLYYGSRALGTIGGFLQNYSISLGSVSIVNAMQGVQFTFILLMSVFLSIFFPKILKEDISSAKLTQKIIAILLISVGLVMLAF